MTALHSVDLTRRFDVVTFDAVRVDLTAVVGSVGGAAVDIERQLLRALVVSNAESVGAMQTAFDMTLAWTLDRYSFGRPLASYQAVKHRMAAMATWLQASHAIADESAAAVAAERDDAAKLTSAATAYIGERGSELLQECVQFHGGIGVTFEHDLHLYLRRHTLNRALYGTPSEHRRRVATALATEGRAA
jgi:alkylation response protein AidB-like acyl-CoA dehydrogenase